MKCILASVFVSVRNWIFRPLLSLRYLNSAGINLNWRRTNLRNERETIIFSIWQIFWNSHNISERYYFWTRKHIEVGLNFLLRQDQMLCISVFMFFESVQAIFLPGHFWSTGGRIHNSRSYVFYVFLCFYVSMFAYMNRVST